MQTPTVLVRSLVLVPKGQGFYDLLIDAAVKPNYSYLTSVYYTKVFIEVAGLNYSYLSAQTDLPYTVDPQFVRVPFTIPDLLAGVKYEIIIHAGTVSSTYEPFPPFNPGDSFEGVYRAEDAALSGEYNIGNGWSSAKYLPKIFGKTNLALMATDLLDVLVNVHHFSGIEKLQSQYDINAFANDYDYLQKLLFPGNVLDPLSPYERKSFLSFIDSVLSGKGARGSVLQAFRTLGLQITVYSWEEINTLPNFLVLSGGSAQPCTVYAVVDNFAGDPTGLRAEVEALYRALLWICTDFVLLFRRSFEDQVPPPIETFVVNPHVLLEDELPPLDVHEICPHLPSDYEVVLYSPVSMVGYGSGNYGEMFNPGYYDRVGNVVVWGDYDYADYVAHTIPSAVLETVICGASVKFKHYVQLLEVFRLYAPVPYNWLVLLDSTILWAERFHIMFKVTPVP